jgi:hypothetical protein
MIEIAANNILVRKCHGKTHHAGPQLRWEMMELIIKTLGCEVVNKIKPAKDRIQWHSVIIMD